MEQTIELLKSFANRIARAALPEDAARMARLLQFSGYLSPLLDPQPGPSPAAEIDGDSEERYPFPASTNSDQVGIWKLVKEGEDSRFVRRSDLFKDWFLWADVDRIEPKGAKLRVVLIGESTARGFLYDPVFTPAMALEAILRSKLGKDEIEVIDLARTNLQFGLSELAASSLLLDPDLVIIFAGNNWLISFPDPLEMIHFVEVLREEGIVGIKRLAETQVRRNARKMVNEIAAACANKNIPLVWMIPEFNLGDWREPATNAPYLLKGSNLEWLAVHEEAQRALHLGDFSRASELARKMIELDGGVCAAEFYILAERSRRQGDSDGARQWLELARDVMIWDSSRLPAPRPHSVVQEILRTEPREHQNEVIDLPAIFKEHLKGELPDSRLFLDYCHLTVEGIQVAMAAAASCALRLLKGIDVPWSALAVDRIAPDRKAEAEALFLAAIHNAHWSYSYELVHDCCARSLQLSAHMAELMIDFIDIHARRVTPTLMCRSAERIDRLGSPLMSRYLFPINRRRFDALLLNAIVDSLEEAGIDARNRLDGIWRDEQSVTLGDVNLLDYYYCSSSNQLQEVIWAKPMLTEDDITLRQNDYYKAYGPASRFVFVGEAGCPVRLGLTCRLPKLAPPEGMIEVEANGERQARIVIGHEWRTWDITVPGEAMRDGVNEIVVHWPLHEPSAVNGIEEAIESLFQLRNPDLFPVFGEIHSFTASLIRSIPEQGAD